MTARERIRMIALIASIGGGIAFSVMFMALAWVLWRGGWPLSTVVARINWLGWGAMMMGGGAVVSVIGLGFAVTARRFRVARDSLEFSGGEEDDPAIAKEA